MKQTYFGDFSKLKTIDIPAPAMKRQIFYGDSIMIGRNIIEPNTVVTMHKHPEEQISYVAAGECDVIVEGPDGIHRKHAGAGEIAWFPSNVAHEVITGEEGAEILDIFNPVREDWLELLKAAEEQE